MNLIPDQNVLMAKRAYYATQTVISDMINNEACYPDMTDAADTDERRIGFDDGFPRANCVGWGEDKIEIDEETGKIKEKSAGLKFVTLFIQGLDVKENNVHDDGYGYVTTRDGIQYGFSGLSDFNNKNDASIYMIIYIDVNGTSKPNRRQVGSTSGTIFGRAISTETGKSTYDIFSMYVYETGKIEIRDPWAQDAIDVSKDVVGN